MFIPMMRFLQSEWMTKGEFAHTLANELISHATADLHLCIASHIADTPWYPLALCAEILWDPTRTYQEIISGIGGLHHCLIPEGNELIICKNKNGNYKYIQTGKVTDSKKVYDLLDYDDKKYMNNFYERK